MIEYILQRSHQLLFRHDMTATMQQFVRSLLYSLAGYVGGNSILFLVVVLAGRLLGPVQFGRYALVMAVAQMLLIPMLPGTDVAVMRATALTRGTSRRRAVSSGFVFAAITVAITAAVAFALAVPAASLLGVDVLVWRVAIAVALALAVRVFFDSVIRGKGNWRLQMLARIVDSSLVLGIFLLSFWVWQVQDFRALAGGFFAGALAAGLLGWWWSARRHLSWPAVRRQTIGELWRYGRFGVLGAAGGILLASADKIVLGNLLGTHELGIYQAYYFASIQLTGQLALIFLNVFFPAVVRQTDLGAVLHKLDRLLAALFAPAFLLVAGFLAATLRLFSGEFDLHWRLILLMSLYGLLWFFYLAYWELMASTGPAGMLYASSTGLAAGGFYVGLVYVLAPRLGIFAPGAAFSLAFIYILAVVVLWRQRFRFTLR